MLGRLSSASAAEQIVAYQRGRSSTAATTLSWRAHRRPMLLAIALALFNQLSGINAILYYLNDIFRDAGYSAMRADLQSVAVGVANLLKTGDSVEAGSPLCSIHANSEGAAREAAEILAEAIVVGDAARPRARLVDEIIG